MRLTSIAVILAALIGLNSCETEIDITADYERIPVVFGLLDASVDTQYIMINRTFLGNADALSMAQIEDSMLFDNVDAKIRWFNVNGQEQGVVELQEVTLDDKLTNGIFYAPTHTVYAVASTALWQGWEDSDFDLSEYENFIYKLDCVADGVTITAETELTNTQGAIAEPIPNPLNGPIGEVDYVSNFAFENTTYRSPFRIEWNDHTNDVVNGFKQRVDVRFNYTEYYTDGQAPRSKSVLIPVREVDLDNSGDEGSAREASGEFFFQQLANRIEDKPANLKYRSIGTVEYILSAASDDLTTYLNLGDPISSVGQSRPSFSNINDGNGIGIFGSRHKYSLPKNLYDQGNEDDLRELVQGQHTGNLCFCDGTESGSISVDYGCTNADNWCQ